MDHSTPYSEYSYCHFSSVDVEDNFFKGFLSTMQRIVSTLSKGSLNESERGKNDERDEI